MSDSTNKKTILTIEDCVISSELLLKILSPEYEVISVSNGDSGIKAALENEFINLILMDIELGCGIDGIEVAERILSKRDIPIVFLTSHSENDFMDRVNKVTRYGFVPKGAPPSILLSSIKMALDLYNTIRVNRTLLKEKEILLKEVHHRIKNNMTAVMGILELHASALKDSYAVNAIRDASSRLHSMCSLYDKLYRSEDFNQVSIKYYLENLADEVLCDLKLTTNLEIKKEIEDFYLKSRVSFNLGIIVNEILTNIMKYAFTDRESGTITISAVKSGNNAVITIQDNGVGIPQDFDIIKSTGFGMGMITMMSGQIGGTIRAERDNGTKFVLEFPI